MRASLYLRVTVGQRAVWSSQTPVEPCYRVHMRCALLVFTLLLGLVGPATPVDAEAPAQTQQVDLRVGCFNAWLIPIVSSDRSARRARMPKALRAFGLDVLCLQEVWSAGDQRTLAKALRKEFPHAVRGGGGLMILSRHRVSGKTWIPFPHYPGLSLPEQLARKGILEATVHTPAGAVRVVNSHLALAFGRNNPRSKQLAFLLRRLDKQRNLPLVLAADLNTWPVESGRLTREYRSMLATGLIDAKPPTKDASGRYDPGQPTRIGWPRPAVKSNRGYYPDHVLFRSSRSHALALRSFRFALDDRATALSDHNLLCAHFTLTRRKTPEAR